MAFASAVLAIAWRDVRTELRGRELLPAMAQFMVLALVVANFAFDLDAARGATLGPGILWMVLVFAGLVAFSRAFAGERDAGSLEAMLLTQASHAAILAGKSVASAILLGACALVLLPASAVLLGAPLTPIAFLTVLLAVVGMSTLGCLFAALTAQVRARELLLPVLAIPLWVPYVIVGAGVVQRSLSGVVPVQPLLALVYMDILFLLIAAVAARFVLDD